MKEKHGKKNSKILILIIIAIVLIVAGIALFICLSPRVRDEVEIEIGVDCLKIEKFFLNGERLKNAEFVSDVEKIDLRQVGEYTVKIRYKGKENDVKLKLVDTTAPVVEFQDVEVGPGYQVNAEDFIKSKEDLSLMEAIVENEVDTNNLGEYKVLVIVKDQFENQVTRECTLKITFVKSEYQLEKGQKIDLSQIIYDYENHKDLVNDEEVRKIEESGVGEYRLITKYKEKEYETLIIVKDTKGPELTLKEVSIYPGETIDDVNKFVENVSDVSNYTIAQVSQIDYNLESQDIEIEAVDEYQNKTSKTTKLYITEDKLGPVFSGATNLSVNVNGEVDYKKNVIAKDEKDGEVDFVVDTKNVDLSKAGTYYAVYTAKDKSGNQTIVKRKITVKQATVAETESTSSSAQEGDDVYSKADAVIAKVTNSSMSQTQEVLALVSYYQNQNNLRYTHTYNESNSGGYLNAAKIALTKKTGDCYVHAAVLKLMMDRLGIQNMVVNCTDKSHFWNLIYINGVWRHIDCTPGGHYPVALMKDDQRYETLQWLHQRDWNRSAYPAAN